jgi:hypothetical protein
MLAKCFRRCTQSLQGNAGIGPPSDHGHFISNPFQLLALDVLLRGVKKESWSEWDVAADATLRSRMVRRGLSLVCFYTFF